MFQQYLPNKFLYLNICLNIAMYGHVIIIIIKSIYIINNKNNKKAIPHPDK